MLDIKITSVEIEWRDDMPQAMCCITSTVEVSFEDSSRVHDTFQVTAWRWPEDPPCEAIEEQMLVWLAQCLDKTGVRGSMVWEYLERQAPNVPPFHEPSPTITHIRRFVDEEPVPVY